MKIMTRVIVGIIMVTVIAVTITNKSNKQRW